MSKSQRIKGHSFEREIAIDLSEVFHESVKRNIGQARDGGDDITLPPFRIECKRRAHIAVYKWLEQVIAATEMDDEIPVVVARADQQESIVILRYSDFCDLMRSHKIFLSTT